MSIGKYLTNTAVIGAAIGALGTAKQTRQMPQDWRRILVWVIWAAGFALAIAGAAKQIDDEAFEQQQKNIAQREKAARKAQRRK